MYNFGRIRKIFGLLVIFVIGLFLVSCKEVKKNKEFVDVVNETTSYSLNGIMESFYLEGRKQSEFNVLYKSDNEIKVILKSVDSNDSQIILKNKEGVYVLIPAINKNFKIKSEWPINASYPYLLKSLSKDIVNEKNIITTENETTKTIETKTYLYKDAQANTQKITINKETGLPTEVQIYDKQGNLYVRVVFNEIKLNCEIDSKEFVVDETMTTMRSQFSERIVYENREIRYPIYFPEGCTLKNESKEENEDLTEVTAIMTYDGDYAFTVIQQFVNDKDTISFALETGEILTVLGVPCILKSNGIQTVYEGIEYTVASNNLDMEEIIKIVSSYLEEKLEK